MVPSLNGDPEDERESSMFFTPRDRARSPDMADAPAVVGSTLNCIHVLSSVHENAPAGPLSSSHVGGHRRRSMLIFTSAS